MELHKIKVEELRGQDSVKLRETERDIRRKLAEIRLAAFKRLQSENGKKRGLRKSLARVLTVQHAQSAQSVGQAGVNPLGNKTSATKQ